MPVAISSQEYFAKLRPHLKHDFEMGGEPASWFPGHPKQWGSELSRIDFSSRILDPSDSFSGPGGRKHLSTSDDDHFLSVTVGPDIHIYTLDYPTNLDADSGKGPSIQLKQILRSGHGGGKVGFVEFQPNFQSGKGSGYLVSSGAYLDGRRAINTVRVWDLDAEEGEVEDHIPLAAETASRAAGDVLTQWSQDTFDSQNITESFDKILRNAQSQIEIQQGRVLQGSVRRRTFSADGSSLLVFASRPDHHVSVIAVNSLQERFRLQDHADAIMWAEFSPNNRVIGTSCWDKTVRIWNAVNGKLIHMLTGATNQSWNAAFSPDSSMIAAGAGDQKVRLWNVESGELIHTFEGYKNWVRSLSFSPDGQTLAAGAGDASLRIFSVLSGGDSLQQWQMGAAEGSMIGHFIEVCNVMHTAQGLLIFKTTDGRVYTFDAGTGRKGQFEHREDVVGSIGSGSCITSHDGNWIFIANFDGVVRVWKI